MFKNKKKIIYSLLAATLISSSAASAATYDYTNVRYDYYVNYNSGYNQNYQYNTNIKQNTTVAEYPVFTWTIVNTSRRPVINQPAPPVVEKPQVPNVKPDYGQEDNWKPSYPTKPNYPTTPNIPEPKPEVPTKPNVPAPKPEVPTGPTESVSGISSIEMEVIRLVNIERQKQGMAPLVASSALSNVARKKSEDMAVNNYFSHTSPTYGSSSNMMKTFGINSSYSGENIAKGQLSAESVVRAWMNSSGHRDNIMNPSFKTIGVGYYQTSNGTNLWTQMFTN